MSTARFALRFPDAQSAEQARAALAPDDEGHVHSHVEGATLIIACEGANLGVLRSLDDVLSCLRAAFPDA